jgi:hypothetical protein
VWCTAAPSCPFPKEAAEAWFRIVHGAGRQGEQSLPHAGLVSLLRPCLMDVDRLSEAQRAQGERRQDGHADGDRRRSRLDGLDGQRGPERSLHWADTLVVYSSAVREMSNRRPVMVGSSNRPDARPVDRPDLDA